MDRRKFLQTIAALPIVAAFPKFAQQVTRLAEFSESEPFSLSGWLCAPLDSVAHVRCWNRALSGAELQEEMFSAFPVNTNGLMYAAYISSASTLPTTADWAGKDLTLPFADFDEFTTMEISAKDFAMKEGEWYYQTLTSNGSVDDYSIYDEKGKLAMKIARGPRSEDEQA